MSLALLFSRQGLRSYSALLCFSLLLISCLEAAPTRVSIMTYNVENLFDTLDDPKTQDHSFLPLSSKKNRKHREKCKQPSEGREWECLFLDWNDTRLDAKMKNLSQKILSVGSGKGPDVLILAEVENRSVVELLNKKYLESRYKVTHMDTHDERGIDQAILSRLPQTQEKYQYHTMKFKSKSPFGSQYSKELRGILHAEFDVGTKKLHVLALHLPSQRAPYVERKLMLEQLNRIALALPTVDVVVAGGDFNVTTREWKSEKVYPAFIENTWKLAHTDGCQSCVGTYAYNKEWSFFDMLLLREDREKKARWAWDPKSVQVVNPKKQKFPQKFDPNRLEGDSDHFPLYAELLID